MRINKLTIKNFRGIEELTLELDVLTILIGENNCCKTAVLEAIGYAFRPALRKNNQVFEPDDYRYLNATSRPGDAGPLLIELLLSEQEVGEWSDELIQALNEVIVPDPATALSSITLRVTSARVDQTLETKWEFLDAAGQPLGGQASGQRILQLFQQIVPYFMIPAIRDADREFQARGSYWGPFVRDIQMGKEDIEAFEDAVQDLNSKIVEKHGSLLEVQTEVALASGVITAGLSGTVSVDALPVRLSDILNKSTLSMSTIQGAKLPLARHGSGLQSLSVFLLFQAFVKSQLKRNYDELAEPVVGIEEPETHLHPAAARVFSTSLANMPGQKIVCSHSGDVIAGIPLSNIRRLYHKNSRITVGQVDTSLLSADEMRKIDFFIRATRGEMLFARVWLLAEGETEYWLTHFASQAENIDLDLYGVRFVPYAHSDVGTFIKVANAMGIKWLVFSDADGNGQRNVAKATTLLEGRNAGDHIVSLPAGDTMETYLIANGSEAIYESLPSHPNELARISPLKGTPQYAAALAGIARKIPCAMKVGEAWLQAGTSTPMMRTVLQKAKALGGI